MNDVAFDRDHYREINEARGIFLRRCIAQLPFRSELRTALDIGCGAGYFSGVLQEEGFKVTGLDLQEENLANCRERYPDCEFGQIDLDGQLDGVKTHDLVLMFGVLYHLQSPLQTIMRLREAVGRVAIVSTRFAAGDDAAMYLFDEKEGQAHNFARVVTVCTLPALVSIFNSAGFSHVYRPIEQPKHRQFESDFGNGYRTGLICAREAMEVDGWQRLANVAPVHKWDPLPGSTAKASTGLLGKVRQKLLS